MTMEDDTMSTGKPDHEITDVNRSYQADDADVTIISADGIHFKVHRQILTTARYVSSEPWVLLAVRTPSS